MSNKFKVHLEITVKVDDNIDRYAFPVPEDQYKDYFEDKGIRLTITKEGAYILGDPENNHVKVWAVGSLSHNPNDP